MSCLFIYHSLLWENVSHGDMMGPYTTSSAIVANSLNRQVITTGCSREGASRGDDICDDMMMTHRLFILLYMSLKCHNNIEYHSLRTRQGIVIKTVLLLL